jgi:hypothetical protein
MLENLLLFLILFAVLADTATFYANLLRPLATRLTRLAKQYRITCGEKAGCQSARPTATPTGRSVPLDKVTFYAARPQPGL